MKRLYVFAGVNGAGKSTFYVRQLEDDKIYGLRINSDELVRKNRLALVGQIYAEFLKIADIKEISL